MSTVDLDAALKALGIAHKTDLMTRTNVLTKGLFGLYKTYKASATGHTVLAMCEIESEALAFSILIPNLSPDAVPGVRVAIAVGTGFPDRAAHWVTPSTPPGSSGWLTCTANGETSATLAPAVDSNIASWTRFDLAARRTMPEASGGRPIVAVRIQFPAGSLVTAPANGVYGWRVDGPHRLLRVSSQDVLGVDDLAAYTTTSSLDDNVCVPVIQYTTLKQGIQLQCSGDSTVEGIGSNTRCYGATQRAADLLSTPDLPVEYCNSGLYAQGPLVYSRALSYYANQIQPSTVVYSPYSINNTPAGGMPAYAVDEDYFGLARVLTDLRNLPRAPKLLLLEGLPTNPAYRNTGAGDAARLDINEFMGSVGSATVVPGYAEALSGATNASGQMLIKDGLTADDVHPNDAGYDALAAIVRPYLL